MRHQGAERVQMAKARFEIVCEWDSEAKVWYVANSNVPGLSAEAPTCEAMNALLMELVPQLVQLNLPDDDFPLELLIKSQQKVEILHC